MRSLALLVLVLPGCLAGPGSAFHGSTRAAPAVLYSEVRIVEAAPPGARFLGVVRGRQGSGSADSDMLALAANVGADVVVVTERGWERMPGFTPVETVEGRAYRVRE